MKKINKLLAVLLFLPLFASSQEISLDTLVGLARKNWPLQKQQTLTEQMSQLKIRNNNAIWIPTVYVNAQATYQSDVTTIPISLPNFTLPEIAKDAYKLTIDAQQIVFDGGVNKAQNALEKTDQAIQEENINAELKKAELMTADVFFNILLLKKNEEQLLLMQTELTQQINTMESRVKNGIAQQSTLEILKVESITLQQKLNELIGLVSANTAMLSTLSGLIITPESKLIIPPFSVINEKQEIETPELKLFELNTTKLSAVENLTKTRNLPVIAAFAQAGYGRPGLNMFTTEFDTYYLIGLKASWSIWRGGNTRRDKQIIEIQKDIVQTQKESYIVKMEINRIAQNEKINNINNQLISDYEILSLRENILKSYSSQMENGVITATEYLNQLNLKTIAAINFESHKLQLLKEQYNYLRTFGK